MAFLRFADKLTVHFFFSKFIEKAPGFRKRISRTKKSVVLYMCVSVTTRLDNMNLGLQV